MALSSVSDYDLVKLVATWFYSVEERFNCEEQKRKFLLLTQGEQRVKNFEDRNGCNGNNDLSGYVYKATNRPRYQWENIVFYNCFCQNYDRSTAALLHQYSFYSRGIMPFAGPLVDQPAKAIEAFSVLDSLKNEKQREEEAKALKRNRVRNG